MQPGTTITPGQGGDSPPENEQAMKIDHSSDAPAPNATPPANATQSSASPLATPVAPVAPAETTQPIAPEVPGVSPQVESPAPAPSPAIDPVSAPAPAPSPEPLQTTQPSQMQPEPAAGWQYSGADDDYAGEYQPAAFEPISWSASEYIDHEKNRSWYLGIGGLAVLVAGVVYLITRDIISSVVIVFAGALLAVGGARKPRTRQFVLDENGIQIGEKQYPFGQFKSFAIIEEGAFSSIQLMPAQRFAPSLSLYYPPEQEDAIIGNLGNFLPHEERKADPLDRLMRRIKF